MTTQHVVLSARDGYFFKDGRGWETSWLNRAGSFDWPFSPTVLGAARGTAGRAREARRGPRPFTRAEWVQHTGDLRIGAMLPLRRSGGAPWQAEHRMWPVPADALYVRDVRTVQPQRPMPLPPGVHSLGRMHDELTASLWWPLRSDTGKPTTPPRWWTDTEFSSWLHGEPVHVPPREEAARRAQPIRVDVRLAIDPQTFTAAESRLFSMEVVEPFDAAGVEWALAAEFHHEGDGASVSLTSAPYLLGGNSRIATSAPADASLFANHSPARRESRGLRLVAVSPTQFLGGWLPDGFALHDGRIVGRLPGLDDEVVLRAAMVPRATYWSGWSMERGGPRSTTSLVPAGSVYFVEKSTHAPFTAHEREALWFARWGQQTDIGLGAALS